ncbi:hypothetical protein LF1_51410 [Rubripirellula obstinata]|uniref:Uncharacterized protein n=1 Tax=Rubripirellula obstinata TaxID=406547 RepID=A0A5B1CTL8_9BACT|nr:hypothetical protein [Rubripirellula obstinata]KAA1262574.1 hypothetical protein LF1_51410 [Rubripirellula obstinata]
MSTQLSNDNRKQPPSIYTVMLLLSMLFMLIAVIAMWIELSRWSPEYHRTNSATPQAMVMPVSKTVLV